MDSKILATTLAQLGTILKSTIDSQNRMADHAEKALIAVTEAANETLKYEAWRDANQGERDRQREMGLAGLWKTVSIYVMSHDAELANRLEQKGEYWMDPDKWTAQEIRDARIELERVNTEAKRMLKPKLKR